MTCGSLRLRSGGPTLTGDDEAARPVWLIMPKARELLRFVRKLGYEEKRQTGSHRILVHPDRPMLVVPIHSGDLPRGLFLRILKDAGSSEEEFYEGQKKGKA